MNKWMGKNAIPNEIGWYYVRRLDGGCSVRYWDDSAGGVWSLCTAGDGFTPNNSFVEWLHVPQIHNPIKKL